MDKARTAPMITARDESGKEVQVPGTHPLDTVTTVKGVGTFIDTDSRQNDETATVPVTSVPTRGGALANTNSKE